MKSERVIRMDYNYCQEVISWAAWAAVTKYHRLGGLNSGHLFLTVLEARKSEIRILAWLGSGQDPLPGL